MRTALKQIRAAKDQTTYEVAKALQIAQSQYFRVENAEASASPELAHAIADHFKVKPEEIFTPSRYVVSPAAGAKKPSRSTHLQEAV